MSFITIATWNLERPSSKENARIQRIRSSIQRVVADIWVLTETRAALMPEAQYLSVHSQPRTGGRTDSDERWVSVWSRWSATSLSEDLWSATVHIDSPIGELLVHGVVLPYMHEPGQDGQRVPGWSRFKEELLRQQDHWMRLREQYPGIPLVVAGDLNQNLDGKRWYGSPKTRHALRQALNAAGLNCLTLEDVVASGKLRRNHLIDHICATDGLTAGGGITCWEPITIDGLTMSDHPGVAVQLGRARSSSLDEHGRVEEQNGRAHET